MKIKEIIELLNGEVHFLNEEDEETEIITAAASDLMSDILASVNVPDILLTGLTNPQVIRTSSVFGIKAVVIVRGRPLEPKIIELAKDEKITLISTRDSLFVASGRLYEKGIQGSQEEES